MFPSFLLSLREGLEAALIIGIAFGALRKFSRSDLGRSVWAGTLAALAFSLLVAVALNMLGAEFDGQGEQIFEGITMLLAAGLLTWMIFWMKSQSGAVKHNLEREIRRASAQKGRLALFLVAFFAVAREGVELALFLLATRLNSNPLETLTGATLGLGCATLLGWVIFATTRKLSLARFFQATNVLLLIFAAGLVGMAVHEFNEAGWIPALVEPLWNTNSILPESSSLGLVLKSLIGYNGNPSLSSVLAYLLYLGVLAFVLLRPRFTTQKRPAETS